MQLKVVSDQGVKKFEDLKIGDLLLCEDGDYHVVKNIMIIAGCPTFIRTSTNFAIHLSPRIKLKTENGFKTPDLWDILILKNSTTPMITSINFLDRTAFFYDILIEGNLVSPDGIIFRFNE